jgi:tetrapyrrole methylase family protein/MazG family protein
MNKPGIILLGLGPGDARLLTREAWEVLENADEVYLRTSQHPTVAGFPAGLAVHSFDAYYEASDDFAEVYERIINEVLNLGARPKGVVYAVPGHPAIAETTGPEIIKRANELGIPVRLVEGISFLPPTLAVLGVDLLPQLSILDAYELVIGHHPPFPPSAPALIAQVHSPAIAAEVKLTLMALYPDEHPVQLVHAAGTGEARVEAVQLHAIDHSAQIGLLTSLYVPPLGQHTAFEDFQELIAHLRAPEGCPWDREQTHQTLRPNLLEETYEVLNALDADDADAMREEFGDLLLQIVLHAQIAAEYGEFTMSDVIQSIHTKLVRRHPHVFGDVELGDADRVIENWERLKAQERAEIGDEVKGLLDGINIAMPALAVADAYQRRAARVGFDWPELESVLAKLEEEIAELRAAHTRAEKAEELGDLIFALANVARWLGMDPETALRETNAKFRKRFSLIELEAQKQGRELTDLSLDEMEAIWQSAKKE